ncbi:hypothetical protein PAF38_004559 [Salmonella enterica]|nr:hypothetical protein [Salmonella enterica subsp. enterica serovar Newport]EID4746852.1 hypothetical protein [Salmonella enterica]EIK8447749.1 hypothetical protein [Salmonella enterica]EIS0895888.1 hypothetical protein [Salmonella enterica]EIU9277917.1 hypothetical protein [Salmonella enterica]
MEIKKEELIKDLLLSNHELLKQIIINNERKCTEPAADYIIKTMKNIRVEEITDVIEKADVREKFFDKINITDLYLFSVSIEMPKFTYTIKIDTLKNKKIKHILEIENEKMMIINNIGKPYNENNIKRKRI